LSGSDVGAKPPENQNKRGHVCDVTLVMSVR